MGIKGLSKLIQKYNKTSMTEIKITDLVNSTVAIDASLMIYKDLTALRRALHGDIIINNKSVTHIYTMLLKLFAFKKYNINAVFVFDSKPTELKEL